MSVPPHVFAASLAALGMHDRTIRVAHLTGDSLLDEDVRGEPDGPTAQPADDTARHLVFEAADGTSLTLAVRLAGDRRNVAVSFPSAPFDEVVVLQTTGHAVVPVVPGCPIAVDVEPGLTSLLLRHRSGHPDPIRTAWVVF